MSKERPLIIGIVLFALIILTAFAVSIKPNTTTPVSPGDFTTLKSTVLTQGTGDRVVKSGDKIDVTYTGKLTDGTVFDSNTNAASPFSFTIGNGEVIAGWDQGLIGMKVGEQRELEIPSSLGYKSQPQAKIPANSGLVFDVTLVKFEN